MGNSHSNLITPATTVTHGHIRNINTDRPIQKSILYQIRPNSYHNLSSPRDQHHKDYVWKKWHCNSVEQAQTIFARLSQKMQDQCEGITKVKDVHSTRIMINNSNKEHGLALCENNRKIKHSNSGQMYMVKAKIEYSHNNLKQHMKSRKAQNSQYSLQEIWKLIGKICVVAQTAQKQNIDIPTSLSSYLIFTNNNQNNVQDSAIKIKDPWVFGEIKLQHISNQFLCNNNARLRKTFSRVVTNLALMLDTDASSQVTLPQINRVNLKYNVNLATFIYFLKQYQLNMQQFTKLYLKLEQTVIPRATKIYQKAQISQIYSKTVTDSTLPTHVPCSETQQNCNRVLLFETEGKKQIKKCTSQQILPSLREQRNKLQVHGHPHRIQEIKPKNKMKRSEYLIASQTDFKDNHLQQNKHKITNIQEHENKQNMNSNKQNAKSIKNSIQIVDHQFPRKNVKHAIRSSTASSEDSKNLDRSSSARNQAFMRMTGGSNYDLYNHGSSDQLLESIIQSEESIIVKNNQSPLLSLDQQMEQIAQDFLKFENQFNLNSQPTSAQRQSDQQKSKTQGKSIQSFVYHRNSTIIEVTQYNTEQQLGQNNEDQEQQLRQTWARKLEESPFMKEKHRLEQQIVKKTQVSRQNQQQINQSSSNIDESHRQQYLVEGQQHSELYDAQAEEQKYVIQHYDGGSKYQGYVLNGLRHGFGKLYYEDGGSYQGEWKRGDIQGFGKLYYQSGNLAYQGYWNKGEFHGEGKIINQTPQNIDEQFNFTDFSDLGVAWVWYEGNFQHDQKDGTGTILLSNGQKFTGVWQKNNLQGQGTFTTTESKQIKGKWSNNILIQIYRSESVEDDFYIS